MTLAPNTMSLSTEATDQQTNALGREQRARNLSPYVRARWHQRYENWADWREDPAQLGNSQIEKASARSIANVADTPDARFAYLYDATRVNVLVGEAEDTNGYLKRIEGRLANAVSLVYRRIGTIERVAYHANVHVNTLLYRVSCAMLDCEDMLQLTHATQQRNVAAAKCR